MNSSRVYKLVVLLILLAVTAGCAQPAAPTQAPEPTKPPEATKAPVASEPILIAFAYVGPVSDMGWTYTHDEARKAIEAAFPGMVKTAFIENMPYSEEASRALEQFVADGAKMIFINSEYADFVTAVADKHPDVYFLECDGHRVSKNEVWYYVAHWNPTYLIGMAAGLMTKSNKLGYIGSFPVQSVYASRQCAH
jgi:simple sugar transport system substrate-binding protein